MFFPTCEVDVQYGDQSSRIEDFSTPDQTQCHELARHVGSQITLTYEVAFFECLTCNAQEIIQSYQIAPKD